MTRHAVILNLAASVRGERHQVVEGKTSEITVNQARTLLGSIDTCNVVGLRDRAVDAVLIYTAARVGAVAKLQRQHFYDSDQFGLRFGEGRKIEGESLSATTLRQFLLEYLGCAKLHEADGRRSVFQTDPYS